MEFTAVLSRAGPGRGPRGEGRRPRAAGAPAPQREPGAGRHRRRRRRASRRLGRPHPERPAHGLAARPPALRLPSRRHRARVRRRCVVAHDDVVRAGSGPDGFEAGSRAVAEIGRDGRGIGPSAHPPPRRPRGHAARAVPGPARGGRAPGARPARRARHRPRLRPRARVVHRLQPPDERLRRGPRWPCASASWPTCGRCPA